MVPAIRDVFDGGTASDKRRARGRPAGVSLRTVGFVLASTVCYYVATQLAWALTFPDSKVSLFFPPHAVLLSILLLVPTRHWWAYVLAAASAHFLATQQEQWPLVYALTCRGVRRGEMRRGGGGDSPADQVSHQGDHAS